VFGNLSGVADSFQRVTRTDNLLLLLAMSCFWFGCNTAAKELVKERVIFLRERDFNLRVSSYFASKFLVLALIAVVQATLLFGIVSPWCQPPGSIALQWLTLAALAVAGAAVGLLLSALARSEEVATALVPIAVIPQIILAGVVAPLSGLVRILAKGFIAVHWAQQALERLLPESERAFLGRQEEAFWGPWTIVLAQAAVAAAATLIVLWRTQGKAASR
jgi:ABC-type multidrug transport system permease subunit